MKKLFIGLTVVSAITLTGCGNHSTKSEAANYAAAIAEAQVIHAESTANGNVWQQKKMKKSYVDHYIAEAEKAKEAGDDKKAMQLADQALKTAKAQQHQFDESKKLQPAWIK